MPIIAQQGTGPAFGHRDAYEGGQKVGEYTVYAIIAAIVVWGIVQLCKRRPKR